MDTLTKKQFLDYEGLVALWAKIKSAHNDNASAIQANAKGISDQGTLIEQLRGQIEAIPEFPADYSKVNDVIIKDGKLYAAIDGTPVGTGVDVADFIKDGMLDDVTTVTATEAEPINGKTSGTFIKFVWNVAAGNKVAYLAASDICDIDGLRRDLSALEGELNALEGKLTELEGELDSVSGELQGLASTVQNNSDSVNGRLTQLDTDLAAAKKDIETLQAATGNLKFETITKNENGEWASDSEIAPTTSSVVDALNELKGLIPDLNDYYTKGEVYSKVEVNDLFNNVEDAIEVISVEDIEKLHFNVEPEIPEA
jgi:chaperonin cofactor prefoldin